MAKILLIDDEKQTAEYMKRPLEKRGYAVIIACTGKEGLELFPRENPDAVLLDLGLPDIDGREVLKEIKSKAPQIKVIVLSGYKDPGTKKELTQLGADYFLGKPVIPPELYELLKKILDKRQ